jgi:hypothetical protein
VFRIRPNERPDFRDQSGFIAFQSDKRGNEIAHFADEYHIPNRGRGEVSTLGGLGVWEVWEVLAVWEVWEVWEVWGGPVFGTRRGFGRMAL